MTLHSPLGRAIVVSPPAHRLYRALIDGLLLTGELPGPDEIVWATELPPDEIDAAGAELLEGDWIGVDLRGSIVALYPFSPRPTPTRVRIDGEERYAMCATDALGVAPMLHQDVAIVSVCPVCDSTIRLTVRPGQIALRHPASTVIIRRRTRGPAHRQRCGVTRLACSPDHARDWIEANGGVDDVIVSLESAFIEARAIFGESYSHGRSTGIATR